MRLSCTDFGTTEWPIAKSQRKITLRRYLVVLLCDRDDGRVRQEIIAASALSAAVNPRIDTSISPLESALRS